MLKKIGMLVVVSFIISGCTSAPKVPVELAKDFDGIYTLKVQCPPYSGISRNIEVLLGKIRGSIRVGESMCLVSGYVEKDGTVSGLTICSRVSGRITGKVVDWEKGIFEGGGVISGADTCISSWKSTRNKQK